MRTAAIARVWGGSPGVLVCLHNIEFWTVFAGDIVGIAVVVAIGVVWLTVRANGWECYGVEGGNATTLHPAEGDVILD